MKWTDEFKEIENKFGLTRAIVEDAVIHPGKERKIFSPEYSIVLYTKKLDDDVLLVVTYHNGKEFLVDYAFRLRHGTEASDILNEPVRALETLANKYGKEISIGSKKSKFLYNEIFPIDASTIKDIRYLKFDIKEKGYSVLFAHNIEIEGKPYLKCDLALLIDREKYFASLSNIKL